MNDVSGVSKSTDGGDTVRCTARDHPKSSSRKRPNHTALRAIVLSMQWSKCPGAFLCGGTTPCNAGFNGQIASWEDRKDGKSGLLVVGGLGVPGQAVRVSYDNCETWENLTSGSSFTWQYGMSGPVVAARGETVVVWASAGPDLELKSEHSGKPDQFGSFFASDDAGRTWSDVSPADPASSVCHAMAPGSNL